MVLVSLLRLRREAPEATHQNLSKNSCCRNQTATPQNRSEDTRERRGEGGRERTITRKRLLMHGQTGQQTKHAPGPQENPPRSSKSGARLISNRRRIAGLGRASAVSEPRAYMEPMDRTKPIGLFPPVRLSGGATGQRRQEEQGREKEPMRVERGEEMTRGDCCSMRQRREGFGKKS